ncbi:MAG: hypothetical protein IJB90_04000 [Clostridia bacterium]|nr:hypothetical protein [Clostridia bacterium]
MTNNINVRKLEKEDIEKIIPLRVALQIHDYEGNIGIEKKELEEKTRCFLEDNLNQVDMIVNKQEEAVI